MIAALDRAGSVELAAVTRSGLVESRHVGAAAVVSSDGERVLALGDVDALVYPRSTLKPVQAVASLRAGAAVSELELVLACASHSGSPDHVAVVAGMLERTGLDEHALGCPVAWPLALSERVALAAHGGSPSRLTMNCSGKHASFLAATAANDWPLDSYLEFAHPLQQSIKSVVEEYTGARVEHTGVDGCGAPVHAVSLAGLARALASVAAGTDDEASRITRAILTHSWALDGHGRDNTVTIERLGVVAKIGIEGMLVVATTGGVAVALKVLDGSMRATTPVALTLLARVGAIDASAAAEVIEELATPITGGGEVVGELEVRC